MSLSLSSLDNKQQVFTFREGWVYQPGDIPQWADMDFDDSSWEQIESTTLFRNNMPETPWQGIGWFRFHFSIDSTLVNYPLSLNMQQSSSSEIFLDGRLIYSVGKVGLSEAEEKSMVTWDNDVLFPITVSSADKHVMAVRYSNFCLQKKKGFSWPTGFLLSLGEWEKSSKHHDTFLLNSASVWMFFTGICLAFSLLHFLFFVFYRAERANLYYSLFTLSAGILTYSVLGPYVNVDFTLFFMRFYIFKLAVNVMIFTSLLFMYSVFYSKLPKQFWFFLTITVCILLLTRFLSLVPIYFWGIIILFEQIRIVISSAIKKKEGALLIGFGYLIFGITGTYQMLMGIELLPTLEGAFTNPYLYGLLGIFITMSVYLSRSSALTKVKLVDVTNKQEQTIQQLQTEMTERKRAEKLARQQQEKLIQADKMSSLGILVSGVAHEINNPNNFMLLNSNNLADIWKDLKKFLDAWYEDKGDFEISGMPYSELRDDVAGLIGGISEGSERIRKIVMNLKDFARKDPGTMDQKIDINGIVDAATTILANLIKKSTDNFNVECQKDVPMVTGNIQQIEQVIINLISNSCQALDDRSRAVSVTTTFDEKTHIVTIAVHDEGGGIAEGDLKHIMDPFYTTKRDSGGTGLGLSISYKIIKDHGGSLKYESKIGKGTTAIITLPVKE